MNQTCNRVLGKTAPGSLSHLNCIIPSDLTTSISPLPRTSLPLHCNAQPSLQVKPKSAKTRRFHRWMISNRDNHICKKEKKEITSHRQKTRELPGSPETAEIESSHRCVLRWDADFRTKKNPISAQKGVRKEGSPYKEQPINACLIPNQTSCREGNRQDFLFILVSWRDCSRKKPNKLIWKDSIFPSDGTGRLFL